MRADATKPSTAAAKGVTDKVLAQIDLADEKVALKGHLMRVRRLEVQPGGIVPWHSHGDRPALIYIISGEIYEHASNCAVPILHKAGDVARETHAHVALVAEHRQGAGGAAVVRHPARPQRPQHVTRCGGDRPCQVPCARSRSASRPF